MKRIRELAAPRLTCQVPTETVNSTLCKLLQCRLSQTVLRTWVCAVAGQQCQPEHAKAAIFYSINSTQKGLAGIDLGNFLIKQAAQKLMQEFPRLEELSTLSPIPGFSRWLVTCLDQTLLEPKNPLVSYRLWSTAHERPEDPSKGILVREELHGHPPLVSLCGQWTWKS